MTLYKKIILKSIEISKTVIIQIIGIIPLLNIKEKIKIIWMNIDEPIIMLRQWDNKNNTNAIIWVKDAKYEQSFEMMFLNPVNRLNVN